MTRFCKQISYPGVYCYVPTNLKLLLFSIHFADDRQKHKKSSKASISSGSTISTRALEDIIDRLRYNRNRASTKRNYYSVWKQFNEFIVKVDNKPGSWEQRLTSFVGYLIDANKKSTTVKSYVSAIKAILFENDLEINEDTFLLGSLTGACKLVNDRVKPRLPIHMDLLWVILKKLEAIFGSQLYLLNLYKVIFASGYFGLLRIRELIPSPHVIKAKDVQIVQNKDKLLFILRTSKTHNLGSKPELVKITGHINKSTCQRRVCPFTLIRN